jgi:hypothetical protein
LSDIGLHLPGSAASVAAVFSSGKRRMVRSKAASVSLAVICDHS